MHLFYNNSLVAMGRRRGQLKNFDFSSSFSLRDVQCSCVELGETTLSIPLTPIQGWNGALSLSILSSFFPFTSTTHIYLMVTCITRYMFSCSCPLVDWKISSIGGLTIKLCVATPDWDPGPQRSVDVWLQQ